MVDAPIVNQTITVMEMNPCRVRQIIRNLMRMQKASMIVMPTAQRQILQILQQYRELNTIISRNNANWGGANRDTNL